MSLILANHNELEVGVPLPWALYDQNRTLLLAQGERIRDASHRESLLASGACYELAWEVSDGVNISDDIFAEDEQASSKQTDAGFKTSFTFDDMKLRVEDRLQLEPPAELTKERFTVKVIGFVRGASLLVTMPITANGLRLQLAEKEKLVMRSFSGQNAFGFGCTIQRIIKLPFEYMHLSFPDEIQGIMIRKAPRVKTHLIATVRDGNSQDGNQVSALISDISANGVSLEARNALGNKGDILNLSFRVQLHNIDAYLSLTGVIRTIFTIDAADTLEKSKGALIRHGIEFQGLQPNDSVILQSLIYQQMIENPHKLV